VELSVIICLFTEIVDCVCQVTHGRRTVLYSSTNRHHTVDKNGVHLKITTFSCIKLKNYISQLFLLKIKSCYENKQ